MSSHATTSTAYEHAAFIALPYIPLVYRIFFLWCEPMMALGGGIFCMFTPAAILNTYSPILKYAPSNQIIYDQLGATYLLFAWNQAVVLRVCQDIRIWRALLTGMLVCDVVHFWAGWKVMMREGNTSPLGWRKEDWVAVGSLVLGFALRFAFLMGVGIGSAAL